MDNLDLPQAGDLMLFVMLGERAKKYAYKKAAPTVRLNANSGGYAKPMVRFPYGYDALTGRPLYPEITDSKWGLSAGRGGVLKPGNGLEGESKSPPPDGYQAGSGTDAPPSSPPGFIERNWPLLLGGAGAAGLGYLGHRYLAGKDDREKAADVVYDKAMSAGDQAMNWAENNPERAGRVGLTLAGGLLGIPAAMALRGAYSLSQAPKGHSLQSAARGAGIGGGAALGAVLGSVGHNIYGDPQDLGTSLALRAGGALAGGYGMSKLLGPAPADKEEERRRLLEEAASPKLAEEHLMQPLMTGAFEQPPQHQHQDLLPILAAASAPHLAMLGGLGGGLHGAYTSRPGRGINDTARGAMIGAGTGLGGGIGAALGAGVGGAPGLIGGGLAGAIGGNLLGRRLFPVRGHEEAEPDKKTEDETEKKADFLDTVKGYGQQALDYGQNNIVNPVVDAASNRFSGNLKNDFGIPQGGLGGFMDRNPWAYAPLIGGGLGAGVGLLGSLGSKNKKKNVLGSALTGGLLGAGAGGLAWGARELMGDGKPAAPPAAAASESKPGVEGTPFQNPSVPGKPAPTLFGAPIPFAANGTTDKFTDAFSKSDATRDFKSQAQIPATDAAGGVMETAAKLNQPADYNRLNEARGRAVQPAIDPATGKPNPGSEQAVRELVGLTKDIGGNYAKPTADPVSRVGNANAMASAIGFPALAGVGSSAGPVLNDNIPVPGTGSETQGNLAANIKAEEALASGVKPTENPPWWRTSGAKDVAAGSVGSAAARGVASELAKMPSVDPVRTKAYQAAKLFAIPVAPKTAPGAAAATPPAGDGFFTRNAKRVNSLINPLSDILPPSGPAASLNSPPDLALASRMANAANERGMKVNGSTVTADHIVKSWGQGGKGTAPIPHPEMGELAKDVAAGKGMTGASGIPERSALGRLTRGPVHPQLHNRPAVAPTGVMNKFNNGLGRVLAPLKPKNLAVGAATSILRHATPGAAVPSLIPNLDAAERERLYQELQERLKTSPPVIEEPQPLEPGGKPVLTDKKFPNRNLGR